MFGLSFWELAVVLVVALLVLGPQRLPSVLRSLGKGMRELRQASAGLRSAIEEPLEEVRRPLQDITDDLVDTVYRAEQEMDHDDERQARDSAPHTESEGAAANESEVLERSTSGGNRLREIPPPPEAQDDTDKANDLKG